MSSRFWYDDSYDVVPEGLWQNALRRAMNSKRGLATLRDLEAALLALPEKRLIEGALVKEGEVCAVGAFAVHQIAKATHDRAAAVEVLQRRAVREWGYEDSAVGTSMAGEAYGMARTVAWDVAELNDERLGGLTPEQRYEQVLQWTRERIKAHPLTRGELSA